MRMELMWAGQQVWDFETIDTADQTDDSGLFEMEPMNELRVGHDVQLYTIVKSVDEENEPTIWYAQVGQNRFVPHCDIHG